MLLLLLLHYGLVHLKDGSSSSAAAREGLLLWLLMDPFDITAAAVAATGELSVQSVADA